MPAVPLDASQSVARVDNEPRVVAVVVRFDDDAIVSLQDLEADRKAEIVATHLVRSRNVWIVIRAGRIDAAN